MRRSPLLPAAVMLAIAAASLASPPQAGAGAEPCPGHRLGLALSGGGAKGLAHIGVLRALEQAGIRPHAIAGTSMGAVVGGLYATGMSPDEIAAWAAAIDWKHLFSVSPETGELPIQERDWRSRHLLTVGLSRRGVALPTGLTSAQRLQEALARRTANLAGLPDFDHLPIPFRALATDLVTGEEVVLSSGSLEEALRASVSVPVAFTPVEVGGRLLVDGGIVKNLPVDVVRAMGCDVVIAVDVSAGLRSRDELQSVVDVVDQVVSFQMVASTLRQQALADVVITPDLGGVPLGFDSHELLAARGQVAAERCLPVLQATCPGAPGAPRPVPLAPWAVTVRHVRLEGEPDAQVLQVAQRLRRFEGQPLSMEAVQEEVARSYATGAYERLSAAPEPVGGGLVDLRLTAKTRHPTSLSVGARYDETRKLSGLVTLSTVSLLPGRLTADLRFGTTLAGSLEYFHAARRAEALFVLPRIYARDDFRDVYEDGERRARLTDRVAGAEVGFGLLLRRVGLLKLLYRYEDVTLREEVEVGLYPGERARVGALGLSLLIDTLQRPFLPDHGLRVALEVEAAAARLGSDQSFEQATLRAAWHHAVGSRVILGVKAFGSSGLGGDVPLYRQASVGGPEPVPGLEREELRGSRAAALHAQLAIRLFDLPLGAGGSVFLRLLAGAGYASGVHDATGADEGLLSGAGVGLAADTLLGPVLLDVGVAEDGREAFTLSVGHEF